VSPAAPAAVPRPSAPAPARRKSDARPARQSQRTDAPVLAAAPADNGQGDGRHQDGGFEEF
jgi:hypothetical protein